MKNKYPLFLFAFCLFTTTSFAQDKIKTEYLPKGNIFAPLIFDPTETQHSGSLLVVGDSGTWKNEVYIPVSISIHKTAFRFTKSEHTLETGIDGTCYTQFNMIRIEGRVFLGSMLNADYLGGIFFNYKHNDFAMRLKMYHVSSHLADDYILRTNVSPRTPSTLDREQADLIASYRVGELRYYAGFGYVLTPNAFRKRFSTQFGLMIREHSKDEKLIRLIAGTDCKIFAENNFRPNIKAGFGIETGRSKSAPMSFILEYYNGHLPYSTLEHRIVQWLGISLIFDAF